MNCRRILPGAGLLLLLLGLTAEPVIQAQAPANQDANPEVLTRGPVHEGFVTAVGAEPRASAVVAKQPPEPIPEEPPEQKPEGADVRWLNGYWAWDDDRADFIWVSGAWRDFPPDREWVPGYWAQLGNGWQWVPGFWQVETQTEVRYLPEPPASVDNGPSTPAPTAESTYVAGVWVYGDTGYRWRPGFWVRNQPNWVWTPAHYCWTPSGYVFVDGCWDYPIARRGLLFAPIWVRGWQPNWVYRPRYLVYETALLTALFVRPRFGGYYFGDYYEPRYAQRGFVAWVDYQPYRGGRDSLYSYYRWQNRDNARWDTDLRAMYDGRRRGDIPRPATTLVAQQQQIQNVQKNTTVNNVNVVNNLTTVAALNQVDKSRVNVKLREVTNNEIVAQRQAAKQRAAVVSERRKVEVADAKENKEGKIDAPGKAPAAPKVAKLELPKAPATAKKDGGVKAPPPPEAPRAEDKPGAKLDPKADPKGKEQRPEPKVDPKGKQPEPAPKPEPKGKVEQKPEPKADPKIDPKGKIEQKPEPKVDPKGKEPAPKPAPKAEDKPEPKPAPKVEPKPAPKEQQPEPKGKPEPKLPVPEKPAPPPAQPSPKAPVTPPEPAPKTPTVTPQPRLPVPNPTPQPRPVPEPPAPKAAPPAPPPPPPVPKSAPPAPAPKAAPPAPAPKVAPPAPAPKGPPPSKDKDKDVLFEEPGVQELR